MPLQGRLRTFGEDLRHFARSLDILDRALCNQVADIVKEYLDRTLSVHYVEIVAPTIVNGEPGIETVYSSTGERHATSLRHEDGTFRTQLAMCFGAGVPLWLVSPDGEPLESTSDYTNSWKSPNAFDAGGAFPRYVPPDGSLQTRTSIMVPAKLGGRTVAAIDLESTRHLEITEDAKRELERLGEAVAHLRDCCNFNESRTDGTKAALETLKSTAQNGPRLQLAKPTVFFAFPGDTDRDVVAVIHDVLDSLSEHLSVSRWDHIQASGNITRQISEAITTARFGICYFSEYLPGDRTRFRDNPNVLFEAGMLHALGAPQNEQSAWIPVREEASPPAPFDVLQERMLIVDRYDDGSLKKEELREKVGKRVAALLGL